LRCAGRPSPISRSATRASISPIAAMIFKVLPRFP
jgi:hypothetical protein